MIFCTNTLNGLNGKCEEIRERKKKSRSTRHYFFKKSISFQSPRTVLSNYLKLVETHCKLCDIFFYLDWVYKKVFINFETYNTRLFCNYICKYYNTILLETNAGTLKRYVRTTVYTL